MLPLAIPERLASISVVVRVRPFTPEEENKLIRENKSPVFYGDGGFLQPPSDDSESNHAKNGKPVRSGATPAGLRKIVDVVDDKMLIFDPPELNPLNTMQRRAFPNQFRGRIRDYKFVFDSLFDEHSTQQEVFCHTTKPLLDSVLDGYNATVFAYGATGCGKTHTILGSPENPGVIFLTMQDLYHKIGMLADTRVVNVTVSFLEIYNETIRDLLNPATPAKLLILREDLAKRIVVANLLTHTPHTVEDVMQMLVEGNLNRTSSPTEANAASSRSHAVLQINVTLRARTADTSEEHTYATLSVIDLAGSERAAATKNRGARLTEGANINKSLLALGNCINALCDPRRRNHVPYRDLKLTRLLKFSLGGNCKTVMIVCISPLSQHYDETLNTLKYANRAKEIKTKVTRNRQNLDRHVGSYLKMITEQKQEIEELRLREAAVVEAHVQRTQANHAKCYHAIGDAVSGLHASADRTHHVTWRKCFLLAKRKFLLLQLRDLRSATGAVQRHSRDGMSHAVRRFLVQAEQLQNKLSGQIVSLENHYEQRSEDEEMLQQLAAHSFKRLAEMEGWTPDHTHTFHEKTAAVYDRLQRDILVNSSVLFDFLLDGLDGFAYLLAVLKSTISTSQKYRAGEDLNAGERADAALEQATATIESMNGSEYDLALEAATSEFIELRSRSLRPDSDMASGDLVIDLDEGLGEHSRRNSNGHRSRENSFAAFLPATSPYQRSIDKRGSTSPLCNTPAVKRSARSQSSEQETGSLNDDGDISIDDSGYFRKGDLEDDDSPIINRMNTSVLDMDQINGDHMPESPPLKRDYSGSSVKLTGPRVRSVNMPSLRQLSSGERPLLNKQASTKVASAESASAPASQESLDIQANSSFMDE